MTVTREKYQLAFGKRLNHVMQASKMSYRDVASRSDIGANIVCRWANGQAIPSVFTFAKFCLAMKLDAHTICALLGVNAK